MVSAIDTAALVKLRLLLGVAVALAAAIPAPSESRPLTIDDLLKLETFGAASIGSNGEMVWEQSPPYEMLGDFGGGDLGAWQGNSFQLMRFAGGRSQNIFTPSPGNSYRLGPISPGGRFLAYARIDTDSARLGIFDFQTGRGREFPFAPNIRRDDQQLEVVWIGADRIAVSASNIGDVSSFLSFRRSVARRLSEQWQRTFAGKAASRDIYDNRSINNGPPSSHNLIILNALSGRSTNVASGRFSNLTKSDDGHYLAAADNGPIGRPSSSDELIAWIYARSAVLIFDLQNMRAVPHDIGNIIPSSLSWRPRSHEIGYFTAGTGSDVRNGRFETFQADTARTTRYANIGIAWVSQRETGGPDLPHQYAWTSDGIAILARPTGLGAISADRRDQINETSGWYALSAETGALPRRTSCDLSSDRRLFRISSEGRINLSCGETERLPEARPLALVSSARLPPGFIAVKRQRSAAVAIYPFTDGSLPSWILDLNSTERLLAVSPRQRLALVQTAGGRGARLDVIRNTSRTTIVRLNAHLSAIDQLTWRTVDYEFATAGTRHLRSGCLLLPTGHRQKYPLVVEVYPERGNRCRTEDGSPVDGIGNSPAGLSAQMLASRGYAVFQPDTSDHLAAGPNGPQERLGDLIEAGVARLVNDGIADEQRIAIIGFSQGGFSSLWASSSGPRSYQAVISINGWVDNYVQYLEAGPFQEFATDTWPLRGDAGRYLDNTNSSVFYMGMPSYSNPDRYIRNGPLINVERMRSPSLLITSDMDIFNYRQYFMMFNALNSLERDARLIVYRGEGHWPSSPANIRDLWDNVFEWLDRYMGSNTSSGANQGLR